MLDSLSLILPEAEDDFFDLLISFSGFAEQETNINENRNEIKIFLIILKIIKQVILTDKTTINSSVNHQNLVINMSFLWCLKLFFI